MAIESLPAVNDVFGAIQSQNGATFQYGAPQRPNPPSVGYYAHVSRREYPSNNNSPSASFRKESSYRRYVRLFDRAQSGARNESGNHVRYRPIGGNEAGGILSSYYHGYWGNGVSCQQDSNLLNGATTRALNKLQDGKAAIGNSLAESKKTFGHLSDSAIQLLSAYRSARRGNWHGVARHLGVRPRQVLYGRSLANRWLEYQYGWKPLMSDIHSLYDVLGGSLRNDDFYLKGRATESRNGSFSNEWTDEGVRIQRSGSASQSCTVRIVAKLSSPRWRQASQLGLINPLAIAWEVVPFSFLLDWFMPVGNVLEALTARAGLDFVTAGHTFRTGGFVNQVGISGTTRHIQLPYLRMKVFEMQRLKYFTWPKPMIYVRDSPFSTTRSLNALALWRSTMKTR